ncbi:phosphonate metabolism transcriptional regulator PhnF [Jannaschia sp. LMIT008]|uniref:phosphonate metabolism transcriptional regulator PhnF n=1 Tax=Jannaschia maritima TaxID=3032585 RepID=UPI002810FF76|nr:phosphonate metabolism transcriptional regulator PhnF [Jannaschia sp. LMIT008]
MTLRDRIAAELRDEIASGAWSPGDKLPSEARLAARFGVHRHTLRAAVASLAEEGLLRARRGAGTFVAARPVDYALGRRTSYSQNLAGRMPERRVLSLVTRAATVAEAIALQIGEGATVHAYDGLSLSDGMPIALFSSVFPGWISGLSEALPGGGSVTAALASCGVPDYARVESRIDARAADAVQAGHLQLREGAPLARVTSLNAEPSGRPVERGRTWFAGERVTLVLDHP